MTTPAKPKRLFKTLLFVAVVGGVIAAFVLLSERKQERPLIPGDANHGSLTEWQACLACHAPGKASPLKPSHPLSNQKCFRCHSFAAKPLAPR